MMRTHMCLELADFTRMNRKEPGNSRFGGGQHQLPDKGVARAAARGCRGCRHPVQDILVHHHRPAPLGPHHQAHPRLQASQPSQTAHSGLQATSPLRISLDQPHAQISAWQRRSKPIRQKQPWYSSLC